MQAPTKHCPRCEKDLAPPAFGKDATSADGRRRDCRDCTNKAQNAYREGKRARAKQSRLDSDFEPLRPSDVAPTPEGEYSAPEYDREKKQEYSEGMGQFLEILRGIGADPEKAAAFASLVGEQERRWVNKRLARAQTIGTSRDLLFARHFEQIASRVIWPVRATGCARAPKLSPPRRMDTLALSDLHFGARLPGYENPVAFDFLSAGRRLARLAVECAEFKTQYRDVTHLNLGINGDVIEGLLGWNDADNDALAEQMVAAGHFLCRLIEFLAAEFNSITVFFEPGNHGRNKITHPGRATSSKWNSYESALYQFVAAQCSRALPNVTYRLPKAPAVVIPLLGGHNALMLHGDTELALKAPSSSGGHKSWNDALNFANSPQSHEPGSPPMYGVPVHVVISGHFHDPDLFPLDRGFGISQGALVPSNGHARSAGYGSRGLFWIFESVDRWAVGDNRPLRVGPSDDADSGLDAVIPRYEWRELIEPSAA